MNPELGSSEVRRHGKAEHVVVSLAVCGGEFLPVIAKPHFDDLRFGVETEQRVGVHRDILCAGWLADVNHGTAPARLGQEALFIRTHPLPRAAA